MNKKMRDKYEKRINTFIKELKTRTELELLIIDFYYDDELNVYHIWHTDPSVDNDDIKSRIVSDLMEQYFFNDDMFDLYFMCDIDKKEALDSLLDEFMIYSEIGEFVDKSSRPGCEYNQIRIPYTKGVIVDSSSYMNSWNGGFQPTNWGLAA